MSYLGINLQDCRRSSHRIFNPVHEVVKENNGENEAANKHIKNNFYMEGSLNIDLRDFSLLLNTDICGEEDIKIITIVSTAIPYNAGRKGVEKSDVASPHKYGVGHKHFRDI